MEHCIVFVQSFLNKYILGGEFAMWTDEWCHISQCFDEHSEKPSAYWMYEQRNDKVFMQSLSGMVGVNVARSTMLLHFVELCNFMAHKVKMERMGLAM